MNRPNTRIGYMRTNGGIIHLERYPNILKWNKNLLGNNHIFH